MTCRRFAAICLACLILFGTLCAVGAAQEAAKPTAPKVDTSRGDAQVAAYFQAETALLRDRCLAEIRTIEDWQARREQYRRELFDMLGLDPLPDKTDLRPVVTGTLDHPEFTVENLHFQARPGLYVTGSLYVPKGLTGPVPAVLYVCGHGRVVKDGVSLGNKAHYQHHGAWFARNGYVCLIIDTLQLGEIEGVHHGTYRYNRWWWLSRGYTPAGVEAWNCIRALDYLQSRPEVDGSRLGVTGRSGGGAYSWWISALDDRIRAAVPVAGITDLQNHVVDGAVEGHCDCMYLVNTYRWDYPLVAALNYPRALLISNTDRDRIFPLDGVYRTYAQVRRLYELGGKGDLVALNITAGGHVDTQELQVHAFRWFDQHLRKDVRLLDKVTTKFFEPERLRVFETLPADELNTKIDETFVPVAPPPAPPQSAEEWSRQSREWRQALREKTFRGWPEADGPLELQETLSVEQNGLTLRRLEFTSQTNVRLPLYIVQRSGLEKPDLAVLNPVDQSGWKEFLATLRPSFSDALQPELVAAGSADAPVNAQGHADLRQMLSNFSWAMAYVPPRGVGPTLWNQDQRKDIQIRRRFSLLGQTWEGMQAWDIRRAIAALKSEPRWESAPVWLQAKGDMAALALYAAIFEPRVARLDLYDLPLSHQSGPPLLNVLKTLDMPQAAALAAEHSRVVVYRDAATGLEYLTQTAQSLGWPEKQVQIRQPPPAK